jgi:hypothetical protein
MTSGPAFVLGAAVALFAVLVVVGSWSFALQLIPITNEIWKSATAVAVITFVGTELFQHRRARASDKRKLKAIRRLLARECELNYWTVKALRFALDEIKSTRQEENSAFSIENRSGGAEQLISFIDGNWVGGRSLPHAHPTRFDEVFLEVAALSESLSALLDDAMEATADLEHLRNNIIRHVNDEDGLGEEVLYSLTEYGENELSDIYISLSALHRECTGKELLDHRVR